MKSTEEIIAILQDFKARFGAKYGIEKMGIFGSVARGEQHEESDVDVCIKLNSPDYFKRMEIREMLEELLQMKVDVISLSSIMRNLFRNKIEQDAIFI